MKTIMTWWLCWVSGLFSSSKSFLPFISSMVVGLSEGLHLRVFLALRSFQIGGKQSTSCFRAIRHIQASTHSESTKAYWQEVSPLSVRCLVRKYSTASVLQSKVSFSLAGTKHEGSEVSHSLPAETSTQRLGTGPQICTVSRSVPACCCRNDRSFQKGTSTLIKSNFSVTSKPFVFSILLISLTIHIQHSGDFLHEILKL